MAGIVIVINPQKPEVVQELVIRAAKAVQEYLAIGYWRDVKLVLRFLACLQGLLEEDGVFPLLDELFSRAVDLQTSSSEDVSTCLVAVLLLGSKLICSAPEPRLRNRQDYLAYDTLHHGLVSNGM